MGYLPPYHESYHDGPITDDFVDFYKYLIELMKDKVDFFIMETQVSFTHVYTILRLLDCYAKNKKVYISIYPSGNIKREHIKGLELTEIKCGFYCNLIHEKKYSNNTGNKQDNFKLTDYINVTGFPDVNNFTPFLKDLESDNEKILIGGCCGYGIKETTNLYKLIDNYIKHSSI